MLLPIRSLLRSWSPSAAPTRRHRRPGPEGLFVRNLLRSQTLGWPQIHHWLVVGGFVAVALDPGETEIVLLEATHRKRQGSESETAIDPTGVG
jgi:hypothetical protein